MTITSDGWFDWAVRDPGPADRLAYMGGKPTPMDCIIHHQMSGTYRKGGYVVFRDPSRFPTLWHGTVDNETGILYQHAPVMARTVHAHAGNALGPGFELTGFPGEPISDVAIATYKRIHADMREFTGIDYQRVPGSRRGLTEHGEHGPTSCPAGRYDRLWAALEEDEMSAEDKELLHTLKAILLGNGLDADVTADTRDLFPKGAAIGTVHRLTGDAALAYAKKRGFSFALGLRKAQRDISLHTNRIDNLATTLASHKHTVGDGVVPPHSHDVEVKFK